MCVPVSDALVRAAIGRRERDSNKGDYGYIGLMGGSTEYSGAIKLSNLAASAMRSGAGVTRLIVPEGIAPSVLPYLVESTLFPLPDDGRGAFKYDERLLTASLVGLKSVGVGMGMGMRPDNAKIISHILKTPNLKIVLDADALNTIARHGVDMLRETDNEVVITPHPKEFMRLSGYELEEIKRNPSECATAFAERYGVTVLLKGATTYISDGKRLYRNERGTPGMATAGSGDVLSGILTAMSAYISDITLAAAVAAYVNGVAGELAALENGVVSMIASDTARNISTALCQILDE